MEEIWKLVIFTLVAFSATVASNELDEAKDFLAKYERQAEEIFYHDGLMAWAYYTNITDYNLERMNEASLESSLFIKEAAFNASKFNWRNFSDPDIRRQFSLIAELGKAALELEEISELDKLQGDLEGIYSTAEVCEGQNCMSLEPDLIRLFANERDWTKLEKAWIGWRNVTGPKMKEKYVRFVELQNKAAKLNGYKDAGDSWRSNYETPDFVSRVEKLWETVKPLYEQLHAFVRKRLRETYKDRKFPEGGQIPAHLLGNMWGQNWANIYELAKPYPNASAIDITATLIKKGFNATDIIRMADNFFVSLGMPPMPDLFWEKSLYEKPDDGRDVVCHASAWDFYNRKDFRLLQCTDITQEFLEVSHHEMGHLHYFVQYKDQPIAFRDGANHGFHEAVGDIAFLSVATPEYLKKVDLLDTIDSDDKADLNFLMDQALSRIAFLPFGFLIDQWRWSVFQGDTKPEEYNSYWWHLRCKHQGLVPPVTRSENYFDPGAKYHIPGNVPYIRYFVSYILQFQFHKALCQISNNPKPLHRCDIYQSKEAGEALRKMLQLGYSKPWPEALKQVTGTEDMDAGALIEYFKPLYDWLKKENKGEKIGWDDCSPKKHIDEDPNSSAVKGFSSVTFVLLLMLLSVMNLG